jgi:hypothetical protein
MISRLAQKGAREKFVRALEKKPITGVSMGINITQTSRVWLKQHTTQLLQLRNGHPQFRSISSSHPLLEATNPPMGFPQPPGFPSSPQQNFSQPPPGFPQGPPTQEFVYQEEDESGPNQGLALNQPGNVQYEPKYTLYKAQNIPDRGSAFTFQYSYRQRCVYISAAQQKGPKLPPGSQGQQQFDWENKVTLKLSLNEIGKLLSVFEGSELSTSLYHTFNNREYGQIVTTMKVERQQPQQPQQHYGKIALNLMRQAQGQQRNLFMYLEISEVAILKEFCKTAIRYGVGFA